VTGLKINAAEFRELPESAVRRLARDVLVEFFRSDLGLKFSRKAGRRECRRRRIKAMNRNEA